MDIILNKTKQIYEGKAKILYSTADENYIIQYFKDDATAFNAQKKAVIAGKGILNNLISEFIMLELDKNNIATHFVKKLNEREQLVKKVQIIPLEVIIRNITAGSLSKRLGINEGVVLNQPVFEICYKNDALQDPLINDDHACEVLKVINKKQLEEIKANSLKINSLLKTIFNNIGINLVDFKIEFGFDLTAKNPAENIILADEISPDGCRLWDQKTAQKLDKDIFRRDLGNLIEAYQEIAKRLNLKF
ncbi:MAG: phosphoribosylaminoimidazolesuccinocarboxamide synthase [Alphaproteobacteria bacterium]